MFEIVFSQVTIMFSILNKVGKIHVSGVGCLMEQAKHRRQSCVTQQYGGLRCYTDNVVPLVAAPVVQRASDASEIIQIMQEEKMFDAYCLFGPAEAFTDRPAFCQIVEGFQSNYNY